jgi:hypothetical protein
VKNALIPIALTAAALVLGVGILALSTRATGGQAPRPQDAREPHEIATVSARFHATRTAREDVVAEGLIAAKASVVGLERRASLSIRIDEPLTLEAALGSPGSDLVTGVVVGQYLLRTPSPSDGRQFLLVSELRDDTALRHVAQDIEVRVYPDGTTVLSYIPGDEPLEPGREYAIVVHAGPDGEEPFYLVRGHVYRVDGEGQLSAGQGATVTTNMPESEQELRRLRELYVSESQ